MEPEQIEKLLDSELSEDFSAKIQNIMQLLNKNNLAEEEINKLRVFLTDYMTVHQTYLNYSGVLEESLKNKVDYYLNISSSVINACYNEPVTQAKMIMLNIMERFIKDNNTSQEKTNTRIRMKNGISYYDYPRDIENDFNRIGGFANNILIIIGVIIFGILLAVFLR